MKTLLALALFFAVITPGLARLGETRTELKQRYGAPLDVTGDPKSPTSRWTFTDRGYRIVVTLREDRSVSEEITRRDHRDFTLREVDDLLEDNAAPGGKWRKINAQQWRQGERVALWVDRTLTFRDGMIGD